MLLLIYLLVICCPFNVFSSFHHSHVRNNIQAVKYSISRLISCNSPFKYSCQIFIICGFWSNFVLLFFKINYFWKSEKKSKDMYQHKIKVWTINLDIYYENMIRGNQQTHIFSGYKYLASGDCIGIMFWSGRLQAYKRYLPILSAHDIITTICSWYLESVHVLGPKKGCQRPIQKGIN